MENNIWIMAANLISCFIISIILFRFMTARYIKRYKTKYLYQIIIVITTFLIVGINSLHIPILNLGSWLVLYGIFAGFLFTSDKVRVLQRITETELMIVICTVVEAMGSVCMDYLLRQIGLEQISTVTIVFLEVTFSKIVVMFFYFVFLSRLWAKKEQRLYSPLRLILYFVLFFYSLLNIFVIVYSVSVLETEEFNLLLLINLGCIIFANLYFLYFVQYVEENNELKMELELNEQQADIQFAYYVEQEKKYHESLSVLHDVNKHIRTIEELYQRSNVEDAVNYTKDISNILKPLVPTQFTNSPILNILLKDKINIAEQNNINCQTEIENVDLSFMQPIDITTIFGNLLDNAIEAQQAVSGEKYILIKISVFHQMVSVRIENSAAEIKKWNYNKPVSTKGKNHGIGLLNVEKAVEHYEGSVKLNYEANKFICSILLNS